MRIPLALFFAAALALPASAANQRSAPNLGAVHGLIRSAPQDLRGPLVSFLTGTGDVAADANQVRLAVEGAAPEDRRSDAQLQRALAESALGQALDAPGQPSEAHSQRFLAFLQIAETLRLDARRLDGAKSKVAAGLKGLAFEAKGEDLSPSESAAAAAIASLSGDRVTLNLLYAAAYAPDLMKLDDPHMPRVREILKPHGVVSQSMRLALLHSLEPEFVGEGAFVERFRALQKANPLYLREMIARSYYGESLPEETLATYATSPLMKGLLDGAKLHDYAKRNLRASLRVKPRSRPASADLMPASKGAAKAVPAIERAVQPAPSAAKLAAIDGERALRSISGSRVGPMVDIALLPTDFAARRAAGGRFRLAAGILLLGLFAAALSGALIVLAVPELTFAGAMAAGLALAVGLFIRGSGITGRADEEAQNRAERLGAVAGYALDRESPRGDALPGLDYITFDALPGSVVYLNEAPFTTSGVSRRVFIGLGLRDLAADETLVAHILERDRRRIPASGPHTFKQILSGADLVDADRQPLNIVAVRRVKTNDALRYLEQAAAPRGVPEKAALRTLESGAEVDAALAPFSAGVLIVGMGSKSQYKDLAASHAAIDAEVAKLDAVHGRGRWIGIIGGDNFDPQSPDIAHVVRYLQKRHAVRFLAVQNDAVLQYGGVDKALDFVHYVPTLKNADGSTVWGGVRGGRPVGPSAFVFNHLLDGPRSFLKGVMAVGGGPVAREEALYARGRGLNVSYIRAEARFPEVNGPFGSLDDDFSGKP